MQHCNVMILTRCDWNWQFFLVLKSYWFNFIEHTSPRNYTNIQDMKKFQPTGTVAETDVFRSYDKLLYEISK